VYTVKEKREKPWPVFVNLLKSPGIDSLPGGIESRAPSTFTNTALIEKHASIPMV
jgi:hypothetical protein